MLSPEQIMLVGFIATALTLALKLLAQWFGYVPGRGWVVIDCLSDMSWVDKVEHGTIFTADFISVRRDQYMVHSGEMISAYGEKLPFPDEKGYREKILSAIAQARVENDLQHTVCYRIMHSIKQFVLPLKKRR